MGENHFTGTLFLSDGTKFCEVKEIPEFIETCDPDNLPLPPPMSFFNADLEYTGTITMHPVQMRRMRRTLWFWTAKGPLRWRHVRKSLRMF